MRKIKRKEVQLLLNPADPRNRFAKISLPMTRRVRQWNEHLAAAPTMVTDIILDRRLAALEAVLVP